MKFKFLKKAAAFVTATAMAVGTLAVLPEEYLPEFGIVASAEDTQAILFSTGDGSKENPFRIETAAQLSAVRNNLSANYIQVTDIDLSAFSNWVPIGKQDEPFSGTYNGNGHTISNLQITDVTEGRIGLFGYVQNGNITNISLTGTNISINEPGRQLNVGAICGVMNNSKISDCTVSGIINIVSTNYRTVASGIVGTITSSELASVKRCKNYSSINVEVGATPTCYAAGICGFLNPSSSSMVHINNCENYGDISSYSPENGCYAAGISAYTSSYGGSVINIQKCSNHGELTTGMGKQGYSAGITAYCDAFQGKSCTYVKDCYNSGKIIGRTVGGIGGRTFIGEVLTANGAINAGRKVLFKSCYNVGDVSTSEGLTVNTYIGSVIGSNRSCKVEDCYYLDSIGAGGTGNALTSAQLQTKSELVGFDFSDVWEFSASTGYLYPVIKSSTEEHDDFSSLINGKCGDNAYWSLTSDGVLTISGSGSLYCYSSYSNFGGEDFTTAPWWDLKERITKIVVKSGITKITEYAFMNMHYVEEIYFEDGIKTISGYNFCCNNALTKITIPKSVTGIGSLCCWKGGTNSELTIYGYSGSVAETYAKNNNLKFVDLALEEKGYIKLSPLNDDGITVGGGESILAYVYDKDDNRLSDVNLVWTSSDENIVAITESNNLGAVVEGKSAGEATITCKDNVSGAVGELKIVVRKGIDISKEYDTSDTDGDGLPDVWEKYGITYEGEFLDLPAMGADPYKSDLFVEVDWMKGFNPQIYEDALYIVSKQFSEKGHGFDSNGDGIGDGINLHIDAGANSINYATNEKWGSLSRANEINKNIDINMWYDDLSNPLSIWKEFINDNFSNSKIRSCVFRYCIMGNRVLKKTFNLQHLQLIEDTTGISSGIPDQYFIVALGYICNNCESGNKRTVAIAGTFMHEFGHTLGLTHGGYDSNNNVDHTNYKPNYLSIMNYLFQIDGLEFRDIDRTSEEFSKLSRDSLVKLVNYSEFSLGAINENSINENNGIDPTGVTKNTGICTKWYYSEKSIWPIRSNTVSMQPINFNRNKDENGNDIFESSLARDINYDGKMTNLSGTDNDWKHISYTGGAIGSNGASLNHFYTIFNTDQFNFSIIEEYSVNEMLLKHNLAWDYSYDETGHWYECSDCDEKVDFETHTEDSGTVTTEPTESTEGVKTFKCTKCEYVIRTEPIAVLEHTHTLATEYSSDATGHWYTCFDCDEKIDFETHTEDSGTVTTEPTETTEGVKTFKCTHCEYVIRTEPIAVLDHTHTLATDYSSDATGHWYACSDCDDKVDFEAHTEDSGTVTTEPTETTEGKMTFKCTKCGYVIKTKAIPVLAPSDPITAFVERLYLNILNRPSDPSKVTHIDNLNNGESACKVAFDFVFSSEFAELPISNRERVRRMYLTFLNREPDPAGLADWTAVLDNGCSIGHIFYGFTQSNEFTEICEAYGINRGTWECTENRDRSSKLTAFVSRLYTKAMGRNYDVNGLNDHTGSYLENHDLYQLAYNFIFSSEFIEKNLSDEEFVDVMYSTFFDREADAAGKADWLDRMANQGYTREDVLAGFVGSQECIDLVARFGI